MIARRRDGSGVRQLQSLFNIGTIGDLTDGQLLERFATDPDEVAELAFSALSSGMRRWSGEFAARLG